MAVQSSTTHSVDDLLPLAGEMLRLYPHARVIAFYGEMGAGKTTFIRALCQALGSTDTINSPTFALLNEYGCNQGDGPIYHFDLYRIKSYQELLEIGFEEYIYSEAYCLIEWAEKLDGHLPENYLKVRVQPAPDGNSRTFTFEQNP